MPPNLVNVLDNLYNAVKYASMRKFLGSGEIGVFGGKKLPMCVPWVVHFCVSTHARPQASTVAHVAMRNWLTCACTYMYV